MFPEKRLKQIDSIASRSNAKRIEISLVPLVRAVLRKIRVGFSVECNIQNKFRIQGAECRKAELLAPYLTEMGSRKRKYKDQSKKQVPYRTLYSLID